LLLEVSQQEPQVPPLAPQVAVPPELASPPQAQQEQPGQA
jgi:hypothetical protein